MAAQDILSDTGGDRTMYAIEAASLAKTYPGDVRALDGLSFSVEQGTVFGLLGPNGAGKSTTVKILTTLAHPDAGSASVAGHDVLAEPAGVREAIGVVSQQGGHDREATGRENMRLQGQVYDMSGADLERRIDSLLEQFHLTEAADRLAREYSGGMQRRLDIATALVHKPRVLFLDEPTTGLDPEVRAEMWEEIARLRGEGLTVLLTTHYLEEADRLAAQLAIVDKGKVVAEGSPDELKRELRGDAIHVELANGAADGDVATALDGVPGVTEVMVEDRALHARADDGARTVPGVLAALEAAGIEAAAVTVARPSLDDVYLRHAGRTFSEAEAQTDTADQEESR
ncbi:MAG: ATP-binding cassette domain-containing protein [Solirubrobacterales bacterium]|nr:ATP-binding cassette domain-containing protein [Solirubrobacterales bacterium]